MKKIKLSIIAIVFGAVALTSCNKDKENPLISISTRQNIQSTCGEMKYTLLLSLQMT